MDSFINMKVKPMLNAALRFDMQSETWNAISGADHKNRNQIIEQHG